MEEWIKEILGGAYTPELAGVLAEHLVRKEELEAANAQAADWKKKAEEAARQTAQALFDARLNTAIGKAGGRSEKAVRALLDLETLRRSQNPDRDIAAALRQLEQENGYLFSPPTPAPYAAGTGTLAPGGEPDAALRRAIRSGTKGMTVFMVSQRVSAVKQSDLILVLDDGRLAGAGTHEELLASCETYQEICRSQERGDGQ